MGNRNKMEEQNYRLCLVFDNLLKRGIKQVEVCNKLDIKEESKISNMKSGKLKISDEFLEGLHKHYNINPDYIRCNSDYMFDILFEKLNAFVKFVSSWDTVKKGDKNYLHFTMQQSFYDFLLSVDKARLIENNFSSFEKIINDIKQNFIEDSELTEFVVIPKNEFTQIVQSAVKNRKHFSEVIDILAYSDYINED